MDKKKFLKLVKESINGTQSKDYYAQMLRTIWKLSHENPPTEDLKLINTSLKELRYTSKILAPYKNHRKVTIFGSARIHKGTVTYNQAQDFSKHMVESGFMVITGAGPGLMEAGNEGAGRKNSFGFNIKLPFEQHPNPVIDKDPKLINYKYFFTRKLAFVKETDAVVVFPGGFGTHDEAYEVLTLTQTGKSAPMPIIFIDKPGGTYWKTWEKYIKGNLLDNKLVSEEDMCLFKITDKIDEAYSYIEHFYANYHSLRYIKEILVIRIQRDIPQKEIQKLNEEFKDIISEGEIKLTKAYPAEKDESELLHLKRLSFNFNRRNFGRLHQLVDRINKF
ncbi:MAG: TIGR00730 family Rossman fold protein [Deltaproteobacteria bacterium]|nr:TIGR00730 family Rossman fold protein [Deltaproteobacteria bacterium]